MRCTACGGSTRRAIKHFQEGCAVVRPGRWCRRCQLFVFLGADARVHTSRVRRELRMRLVGARRVAYWAPIQALYAPELGVFA